MAPVAPPVEPSKYARFLVDKFTGSDATNRSVSVLSLAEDMAMVAYPHLLPGANRRLDHDEVEPQR